jgi:hypothetical protein
LKRTGCKSAYVAVAPPGLKGVEFFHLGDGVS